MKSRSGKQLLKYTPRVPGAGIDCMHQGVWDDPTSCGPPGYVHVDCWRLHFGIGTINVSSEDLR